MRFTYGLVLIAALASSLCAPASAEFIGLTLEDFPDVASGFIDVTYDAGLDDFIATGSALTYDDDGSVPGEDIIDGLFEISATIDGSGFASSGTLSIGGNVLGFGPLLLTADLLDFGFAATGGQLLEFVFSVTGGDLALDYGGLGAEVGVILDVGANYSGDWTRSFDNLLDGVPGSGIGVSDTAPVAVPAPGSAVLLLAAIVIGGRRRRTV